MAFLLIILYAIAAVISVFILFFIFLFVNSLFVDCRKEYNHHSRYFRWLLNFSTEIAMKVLRVRIKVSGLEKMPEGRFLLVGNHLSNFDPLVTWCALKDYDIAFISKAENFKIPIFGRIIRKCCFMAIDRKSPKKAIATLNRAIKLIESNEVSVGVYPEGTRNKTEDTLLPFHNGVLKIAKKAKVPIVVVTVTGAKDFGKNYPLKHTDINVDVICTLEKDFIADKTTAELGNLIAERITEKLERRS